MKRPKWLPEWWAFALTVLAVGLGPLVVVLLLFHDGR